uniref:Thiol peroxidase n=1 Tax=Caldimicrobium thiodismutans TaxID=1653476 RepID=A0A832LW85_9BACT
MSRTVTLSGNPVTLVGQEVKVGERAPDFTVLDKELKEVKLDDFKGKIKLISVTPSLDTPVCDLQARTFNERAAKLPEKVVTLNISMDLPFALARFCSTANINKIFVLSDHREASFGQNYGLLIKELRLLARAVLIIDQEDIIRYMEIVPEITHHPDYDKAFQELTKML